VDLYRFFDSDDRLLYVGMSMHAARRASQHRHDKAWWPDVARMEVEHRDVSVDEMRALEAEAIYTDTPKHNGKVGRPAIGDRIELRLPPDVLELVDRTAAAIGVKRAELIRSIVTAYVRETIAEAS
jgi:hypothetical protein